MRNMDLVRRAYELFGAGKISEAGELIASDAVWTFPGQNALSGEYRGRDAITNELLPKFAKLSGSTYTATLLDVAEGDQHTIAIHRGEAQRDGQSIDNLACNVFRIEDGLITAVHTYPWDAQAMDAFWTAEQVRAR